MNGDPISILLLCLSLVLFLAIYWTLFKIRKESGEFQEKIHSQLTEISKSLEKKSGGT